MSDVIYVLLTLAVFIALALLVGFLDRHSGGTTDSPDVGADQGLTTEVTADRGAR